MKHLESNSHGFTLHLLMPIIAIIGVAIVGSLLISSSRAATTPYSGTCTGTIISTSTKVTTTKYKDCIFQAQELMDAIQRENYKSYRTAIEAVPDTFVSGNEHYLTMNSIYSTATAYAVKALPGNGSKNELTDGTSGTWQTLCTDAAAAGLATGGKAATYVLSINTKVTGEYSKYTNANNFKSTCGTTTSGGTSGGGSTGSSSLPYATALSAYKVLSQSYTASQMISGNWAADANATEEGGGSCPTANATYDSANSAVKLSTNGTAEDAGSDTDCGHIRSASLISTNGTVVESKIWLPSSGNNLIDWASYWTDGTNWPATGELDAIETQYGASYVTYHYGSSSSPESIGSASWDSPKLSSTAANDAVPGWNTVDMEFEANYAGANVYINGKLYASVPASVIAHNSQYINWGISGPNAADPNHASWPSGPGYEEVQYLKVFTK